MSLFKRRAATPDAPDPLIPMLREAARERTRATYASGLEDGTVLTLQIILGLDTGLPLEKPAPMPNLTPEQVAWAVEALERAKKRKA